MLLCATGEAVMRLDRTELSDEAKRNQEIYLHDQYHETLLQYLENEFYHCDEHSLFIQVRFFITVMVGHKGLNVAMTIDAKKL